MAKREEVWSAWREGVREVREVRECKGKVREYMGGRSSAEE